MSDHIRLMTDSAIVVRRAAALLEENQIPSLVKDNVESARLAGFGTSPNEVDLYINESDFERAKNVLDNPG